MLGDLAPGVLSESLWVQLKQYPFFIISFIHEETLKEYLNIFLGIELIPQDSAEGKTNMAPASLTNREGRKAVT